jgi:hypothetical protein
LEKIDYKRWPRQNTKNDFKISSARKKLLKFNGESDRLGWRFNQAEKHDRR